MMMGWNSGLAELMKVAMDDKISKEDDGDVVEFSFRGKRPST